MVAKQEHVAALAIHERQLRVEQAAGATLNQHQSVFLVELEKCPLLAHWPEKTLHSIFCMCVCRQGAMLGLVCGQSTNLRMIYDGEGLTDAMH